MIWLLLSICMNASASLLLKLSIGAFGTRQLAIVAISVLFYGLAFLSYYACLQRFQVSIAYPVITGGALLTIVLVGPFAGEPLTVSKAIGATMVIFGGVLLLRNS